MKRLENKTAIITGGARGIGKAAAQRLAEEGARVAIWDVDTTNGKATEQELQAQGLAVAFFEVDTTDIEGLEAATTAVVEQYGGIDILINNAAILRDASLRKMSQSQWQQVIDVNLTGVFNCTQAVLSHLVRSEAGRIINTSSIVGLHGNWGQTNYAAAKAGLIGMTKVWAKELGRKGVCVNAVAPGFIATEMVESIPERIKSKLLERIPLARLGQVQDIANVYLFLASEEAAYINGTVISVDGGMTI